METEKVISKVIKDPVEHSVLKVKPKYEQSFIMKFIFDEYFKHKGVLTNTVNV